MKEKDTIEALRQWLNSAGFLMYIGDEFQVKGSEGRRPDAVVIPKNRGNNTALEIKTSKPSAVFGSYKIVDYARDYCNGAKYIVDGKEVSIKNFLVATDQSKDGRLFNDDIYYDEKRRRKQAEFYKRVSNFIEPYHEWARSGDFVRSLWRSWKERAGMENVNVGILLSSVNDCQCTLDDIPKPKMFVMHYSANRGRWTTLWMELEGVIRHGRYNR